MIKHVLIDDHLIDALSVEIAFDIDSDDIKEEDDDEDNNQSPHPGRPHSSLPSLSSPGVLRAHLL